MPSLSGLGVESPILPLPATLVHMPLGRERACLKNGAFLWDRAPLTKTGRNAKPGRPVKQRRPVAIHVTILLRPSRRGTSIHHDAPRHRYRRRHARVSASRNDSDERHLTHFGRHSAHDRQHLTRDNFTASVPELDFTSVKNLYDATPATLRTFQLRRIQCTLRSATAL